MKRLSGNLSILKRSPRLRLVQTGIAKVQNLYCLGVAYYPDYLPNVRSIGFNKEDTFENFSMKEKKELKEKILIDMKRMQRNGIKLVRVGEFSWSTVQPTEMAWCPEVFHIFLDLAERLKIDVIFCTPTATPPKWLVDLYPDMLPRLRNGAQIPFGSRRHYDFCHPAYLEQSKIITQKYVNEFGRHPSVVGWQTDNEFGCHNSVFQFSAHVLDTFRRWLKSKYQGKVDILNEAWFTSFWSQGYSSFEQIELPFESWADQNPGMELDFRRFCNEAVGNFHREQILIIKKESPGRYITHNLMTLFSDLCPWQVGDDIDIVGFDHYQMESEPHPISSHWQFALMRSLKQRKFLILEQQPVQVNWQPINRRLEPDYLFLWAVQSAALGASGMMYFSWQRMYGGAEQYHDAVVPHDIRVENSWQERVLQLKHQVFADLEIEFNLKNGFPDVNKDVLCIYDSESVWSHEITSQSTYYTTRKQIDDITLWCSVSGLGLYFAESVLHAQSILSNFKILVLPGQAFEMLEREQQILASFVQRGGKVISFPRTAYKKRSNQFSTLPLNFYPRHPLILADFGALLPGEIEAATKFNGKIWAERILIPEVNKFGDKNRWKILSVFEPGKSLYANSPSLLQFRSGDAGGMHLHFAACPQIDLNFITELNLLLQENKLNYFKCDNLGIQIIPLQDYLCVVNFSNQKAEIEISKLQFPMGFKCCYFAKFPGIFNAVEDFESTRKIWRKQVKNVYKMKVPGRTVVFAQTQVF